MAEGRGARLRRNHGRTGEPIIGRGQTSTRLAAWCARAASCSSRLATSACPAAAPYLPRSRQCAGRTDVGPMPPTPGYYGLSAGAWQHWARVWNILHWLRAATQPGARRSRYPRIALFDALVETSHSTSFERARDLFFWACAELAYRAGDEGGDGQAFLCHRSFRHRSQRPCRRSERQVRAKYRTARCTCAAATQFESEGSCTASKPLAQWRERVIEPLFRLGARTRPSCYLRAEVGLLVCFTAGRPICSSK